MTPDPYISAAQAERARGRRRLTGLTAGLAAASALGVGVVAVYDAQAHTTSTNGSTASSSSDNQSNGSSDDSSGSSSNQLQAPQGAPGFSQQQPNAVSGGS